MDRLSKSTRSRLMSRVRSKNTSPERVVRSMLHALGYRFRLHYRQLPGTPDIVLPRHNKIVLVHGCFWHGHYCRRGGEPKSNLEYWRPKIERNRTRDRRIRRALRRSGWQLLVVWECETRKQEELAQKIQQFMKGVTSERKAAQSGIR